jgi:hypothetical protein
MILFHADIARTPEKTGGQHDDRLDEVENATDRDAEQSEWQEQNPDKGVENDREQRQGPAHDQQDEPEYECQHSISPFMSILLHSSGLSMNPWQYGIQDSEWIIDILLQIEYSQKMII